jgi:DNA-binding transcriptional ArsR family regulator
MKATEAVATLAALAQETRLSVFRLLVEQGAAGLAAGEIAERIGIAPAALSFHLKELAHARLVKSRQDGRYVFYSADFGAMNRLLAFLTENCCAADGTACGPAACAPSALRSSTPRSSQRKARA